MKKRSIIDFLEQRHLLRDRNGDVADDDDDDDDGDDYWGEVDKTLEELASYKKDNRPLYDE